MPFTLRLNNHRCDVFDRHAILSCRYFAQEKHRFNKHAKFTLTVSITSTSIKNQNKPYRNFKKKRENFWIRTLETL